MRILVLRRCETMRRLAHELKVTSRTIRSDIKSLTVSHPLNTVRGRGGCVKVAEEYHPYKHILSNEQETVFIELLDISNEPRHRRVLTQTLAAYGSPETRKKYKKEIQSKTYERCINAN